MNKKYIIIYFVILITLIVIRIISLNILNKSSNNFVSFVTFIKTNPQKVGANLEYRLNNHFLIINSSQAISIGDRVKITGKVKQEVINPIYTKNILLFPEITIVSKYNDIPIIKKVFIFPLITINYQLNLLRNDLENRFLIMFDHTNASLISGMVLGSKNQLPFDFYEKMQKSGLLHIVVASGGNIILISSIVMMLLGNYMGRNIRYFIAYLIIIINTLLSGADPPIVRASVMLSLVWLAKLLGRKTSSIWILFNTGLIMLIIEPFLIFSLSFQLSMAATLGILSFAGYFQELLEKLAIKSKTQVFINFVNIDLSQTIAAQLLVIPIILHVFAETSVWTLFSNVLVGPVIAPIMFVGLFLLSISYISIDIASFLAIIVKPLLDYVVMIASVFTALPLSQIPIKLNLLALILSLIIIYGFFSFKKKQFSDI